MVLLIISIIIFLAASIIVFRIGWRLLRVWRILREEALLHLTLMVFYGVGMIVGLAILTFFFPTFPQPVAYRDFVLTFGVFYDLFYLEFALFYLALFSNSRRFIEKYIPVIMVGAITLNLVILFIPSENLFLITLFLHSLAIIVGISLIVGLYLRIKANEQYFSREEEQEFIQLIKKVVLGIFIVSVPDGVGFLGATFFPFVITEYGILFVAIVVFGIAIIAYYLSNLVARKGKNCDFSHFFNTIS
ncbi:MAG: hypothetical protein ACFFC7_29235 [Candidatus Hermodarchaeota archaeon]